LFFLEFQSLIQQPVLVSLAKEESERLKPIVFVQNQSMRRRSSLTSTMPTNNFLRLSARSVPAIETDGAAQPGAPRPKQNA